MIQNRIGCQRAAAIFSAVTAAATLSARPAAAQTPTWLLNTCQTVHQNITFGYTPNPHGYPQFTEAWDFGRQEPNTPRYLFNTSGYASPPGSFTDNVYSADPCVAVSAYQAYGLACGDSLYEGNTNGLKSATAFTVRGPALKDIYGQPIPPGQPGSRTYSTVIMQINLRGHGFTGAGANSGTSASAHCGISLFDTFGAGLQGVLTGATTTTPVTLDINTSTAGAPGVPGNSNVTTERDYVVTFTPVGIQNTYASDGVTIICVSDSISYLSAAFALASESSVGGFGASAQADIQVVTLSPASVSVP